MDVSLDTDITIHLYNAGKEELLYKYFDKCYMHEFIIEREIKNKSATVYNRINEEIESGKIINITQRNLIDIGMKKQFEDKVYELQTLFDFGETNAVALASVLGIAALVTDDTKDQGPHDTLVKEYVEDIFAERILNDDVKRPIAEAFYDRMELNNYPICLPIFAIAQIQKSSA